ncbi:MAG: winged helix DNA-binding domain-containing protein [Chloroflexota bacterium]|nr:winged helix DNA-binding domain-containing protein [Chloroflexota bacterium]
MHQLTKAQARRIAVRAQLLDAARPTDLVTLVERLTLLQVDPTAAIVPSADLVAWSRLGGSYRPEHLKQALEQDRTLFEFNAVVRPMRDLGLYLAGASEWPRYQKQREWLRENDRFRRDILDLFTTSGPLTSRDIPDTSVVPWPSSGWTNNRNVTQMLEFLGMRGEVAIAARVGRERVWDLAERVYPSAVDVPSIEDATRSKNERRLAALGIARRKTTAMPVEPIDVGETGEPAVVEGVKGDWRVDPAALGDDFEGRTALLSPFDRLCTPRTTPSTTATDPGSSEPWCRPRPRGRHSDLSASDGAPNRPDGSAGCPTSRFPSDPVRNVRGDENGRRAESDM